MDKYTAKEMATGKLRERDSCVSKTAQTERKRIRAQLKEIEKCDREALEDVDFEPTALDKSMSYENNQPLRNFLGSQIGNSWDDVYSRVCQLFDSRSKTGWRAREYIKRSVEQTDHDRWFFQVNSLPYFKVDADGILRYINPQKGRHDWDNWDNMSPKKRGRAKKALAWFLKEPNTFDIESPHSIWARKVYSNGSDLHWAYRAQPWTNTAKYVRKEELTQDEVGFFRALPPALQDVLLHKEKDVVEK